MLNQVIIVGRLTKEIEGNTIILSSPRQFKNKEGIYETDLIPVEVFGSILDKANEYIKVGDIIGIKGRLEAKEDKLVVVADKLTFLSSEKEEV